METIVKKDNQIIHIEKSNNEYIPFFANNNIRPYNNIQAPEIFNVVTHPASPHGADARNPNIKMYNLSSTNLLDPLSLTLNLTLENLSPFPIKVEDSAHSLIKSIVVYSDNKVVENFTDYDEITKLEHLFEYGQYERSLRRKNEGFGDNQYGTNEVIIAARNNANEDRINRALRPVVPPLNASIDLTRVKNISSWDTVVNGKIVNDVIRKEYLHKYHFKIPLRLKTIGTGLEKKNHKLLPLSLFNNLFIAVHLTDQNVKLANNISNNTGFNVTKENSFTAHDGDVEVRYLNADITSTQYRFPDPYQKDAIDNALAGGWIIDYKEITPAFKGLITNETHISYVRSEATRNLKSMLLTFTHNTLNDKYLRRMSYVNPGITSLKFHMSGNEIPLDKDYHTTKYNSLNTHGLENCSQFFEQIETIVGNPYSLITPKTFCIKDDFLRDTTQNAIAPYNQENSRYEQASVQEYFTLMRELVINSRSHDDPRNIGMLNTSNLDMFSQEMEQYTSHAIFGINFELTPYMNNNIKSEIKIETNIPFEIRIQRDPTYIDPQEPLFCNLYYQTYKTKRLLPGGQFEDVNTEILN